MAASSEEKGLLGASNRPHRRYGSTTVNTMKKPENVIKHRVSKQDTIQGIALRYGVTVESIKQHNKLWTVEAMFLHDYLEVPVSKEVYEVVTSSSSSNSSSSNSSSSSAHCDTSDSSEVSSSSSSTPKACQSPSTSSSTANNGLLDCSETSPNDFLSKIDSNIALMKSSIERMETHAYPMVDKMEVDDSRCNGTTTTTTTNHRSYHNNTTTSSYQNGWHSDPLATPHAIVNPGRTITMSLKRLLREHEELYEL